MNNPYRAPQSEIGEIVPEQSEKPYRYVNYAYAFFAFTGLASIILTGAWEPRLASVVVTTFLILPCLTAASILFGTQPLQTFAIRFHPIAVTGLIAYGIFMISNNQPPPIFIIIFLIGLIASLVWSISIFKQRSNKPSQPTPYLGS